MQYLGGKYRIAKHVADVIQRYLPPGGRVWEPFCGGFNVTEELAKRGVYVLASDCNKALIALWQAVRAGWDPPKALTEAEYRAAKSLPVSDPMHGFAGLCSFGGKFWGGYARGKCHYAKNVRDALLRQASLAGDVQRLDFLAVEPGPTEAVIYCDPPYAGTTGYKGTGRFDHARFVDRVVQWSMFTQVLVSEYDFPAGVVVWERERAACMRGKDKTHTERIYHLGPMKQLSLF